VRRDSWLWLGLGSVAALTLIGDRRFSINQTSTLGLPIDGNDSPKVTPHGYFGAPRAGPPRHAHQGVDIAARPGSYVRAVGDGTIVKTGPGLGKIVRKLQLDTSGVWAANHRSVDAVVYADLGKPLVHPGDHVRRGDPIALVDKAGFVHFAVKQVDRAGEVFFDPKEAGLIYRLSSSGPGGCVMNSQTSSNVSSQREVA
jgi:murein DD-endopeptidase MepM/ murein hydrolase activator NlpD